MEKENKLRDKFYQKEGKRIVDHLFDIKVFNDNLTRDDLQCVEDLIAFYLDSTAHTATRATELTMRLKNK